MYYTILTAIDNHGGKTFFSAADTTEKKSVDKAITNFTIGKLDQDSTRLLHGTTLRMYLQS